jgi:homocysteine S-methyltransferase
VSGPHSAQGARTGPDRQTGRVSGSETVVLDGGMSNALEDLGHDLSDPLWTARMLRDAPEAVAEVHRRYFRAGARVATTASYQASVPGFVDQGLQPIESSSLLVRSVTLAQEVRDELADDGTERWVAASVGPYGAVLADGSEYRGRYGVSAARLRDFHGPRLELLLSAGPDLLAVETIPDLDEAEVLADLLYDVNLPTWFSFCAREGSTAAGQPLAEAFETAAAPTTVVAVGVNCCPADEVLDAVRLAVATGKMAVAYPNGGGEWDARTRTWVGEADVDPDLARSWVDAGATYVGGCCRIGPDEIARLAAALSG